MEKCYTCKKDQSQLALPLKTCAKCRSTQYCSRECQKHDWKSHKKVCASAAGGTSSTPNATTTPSSSSSKPRFHISKPFSALQNGKWLCDRPEADVHQLLSDVFRLRREDQYKFEGEVDEGSVYAGGSASSELRNYRRFLQHITTIDNAKTAEKKLLPNWWSADALKRCIEVAKTNEDAKIEYAVEKSDIHDFYHQNDMPMQLRIFGEALDGTKVNGQSGKQMLELKVAAEGGGTFSSTLSM